MKTIPNDYEPPEQEEGFSEFADGDYVVKSIKWFGGEKYTNNNKPMLVPQANGLVGRFSTILEDGKQGPAYSIELNQMPLLLKAFGAQPVKPPHVNEPDRVSQYMVDLQKAIEQTDKNTVVRVKDRWIKEIKGMEVPDQYFHFYLSDIWPKEENSRPKEGEYGPYFMVEFTVVSGENKSETPYGDCTFSEFVNYAVEVKDGKAGWQTLSDGISPNTAAVRMSRLMNYTASSIGDNFEPDDPNNILIFWAKEALVSNRPVLSGTRIKPEQSKSAKLNKIKLALNTIQPAGYDIEIENVLQTVFLNEEGEDEKARRTLAEVFTHLEPNAFINRASYDLSAHGIEIGKQYITPLKNEGVVKIKQFRLATLDEVLRVLEFIVSENSTDAFIVEKKAALTAISLGFDKEDAEEESPF